MPLKTKQEIELLAQGGAILGRILEQLSQQTKPGVTGLELDAIAQKLIEEADCKPAFLGYAPDGSRAFPAALCVSVNSAVVHGLPNTTPLQNGDIVGLDLGLVYKGLFLDAARTVPVGEITADDQQLLDVTLESLQRGIVAAQVGNTIGDIGHAIQSYVEENGFEIVRQLVGHGVGHAVHEEPQVPNFGKAGRGLKLKEGLVIAIEPMVTINDPHVITADDDWTVETANGEKAAHEEHTIAVTKNGPRILTAAPRA